MKGTSREKPEMMVAPFDSRTRISLPSSFNDTRKREKTAGWANRKSVNIIISIPRD